MEVEWHPYLLRPDMPAEGMSLDAFKRHYGDSYFQQLKQLAEESGIHMIERNFLPNSHKALETTEFVREHGGDADSFHRAVFQAYFEEGRNIGDTAVLLELAGGCGVETTELAQTLQEKRYEERVDEQVEAARRLGISGVPTFIFDGRYALVGAQGYDVFEDVTQRLLAQRAEGSPDAER